MGHTAWGRGDKQVVTKMGKLSYAGLQYESPVSLIRAGPLAQGMQVAIAWSHPPSCFYVAAWDPNSSPHVFTSTSPNSFP